MATASVYYERGSSDPLFLVHVVGSCTEGSEENKLVLSHKLPLRFLLCLPSDVIDVTGGVGTYTVAADCTGTLSITDGPSFNIYVGPSAKQVWTTEIAGGDVTGGLGVGTATRVP